MMKLLFFGFILVFFVLFIYLFIYLFIFFFLGGGGAGTKSAHFFRLKTLFSKPLHTIRVSNSNLKWTWIVFVISTRVLNYLRLPLDIYNKNHIANFFFYLGFLSRTFTNHRTAGEVGGHFSISSLPNCPMVVQSSPEPLAHCLSKS